MSFLGNLVENELLLRNSIIQSRCKEFNISSPVIEVDYTEMAFQIRIGSQKLFFPRGYDAGGFVQKMWHETLREGPNERGTHIVRVYYPLGHHDKVMVNKRHFPNSNGVEAGSNESSEFYEQYYNLRIFEGDIEAAGGQ